MQGPSPYPQLISCRAMVAYCHGRAVDYYSPLALLCTSRVGAPTILWRPLEKGPGVSSHPPPTQPARRGAIAPPAIELRKCLPFMQGPNGMY